MKMSDGKQTVIGQVCTAAIRKLDKYYSLGCNQKPSTKRSYYPQSKDELGCLRLYATVGIRRLAIASVFKSST